MPKPLQIPAANPDQFCFHFGVKTTSRMMDFHTQNHIVYPGASLRRSKRLSRWLEKLSNGFKRPPIGSREASEGVQKGANLRPGSPVMVKMVIFNANQQWTAPSLHFTLDNSQFSLLISANLQSIVHHPKFIASRPRLTIYDCKFMAFSKLHVRTVPSSNALDFIIHNAQIAIHN